MNKNLMKKVIIASSFAMALSSQALASGFSDVSQTAWYYNDVNDMVESGIVSGYTDGTFKPTNSVTIGEVTKMLYLYWGNDQLSNGFEHWADNYANKAESFSWINDTDDLNKLATREMVAEAVLHSIGAQADDIYLQNPFTDTSNYSAITMSDMGIINGSLNSNNELVFNPSNTITRAEFCAILNRTTNYIENVHGVSDLRYLYPQIEKPSQQIEFSVDYMKNLYLYMIKYDIQEIELTLNLTEEQLIENGFYELRSLGFEEAKKEFPEFVSFYKTAEFKLEYFTSKNSDTKYYTKCTMNISDTDIANNEIIQMKKEFLLGVKPLAEQILNNGDIDVSDTEYEIAKSLYTWLALNLKYDTNYAPISYNGYGTMFNKTGVCQGYVSLYNSLCKSFGITDIYGIIGTANGENHIWVKANLDGNLIYIDPTWGDPIPNRDGYCDLKYFDVSLEILAQTHKET